MKIALLCLSIIGKGSQDIHSQVNCSTSSEMCMVIDINHTRSLTKKFLAFTEFTFYDMVAILEKYYFCPRMESFRIISNDVHYDHFMT